MRRGIRFGTIVIAGVIWLLIIYSMYRSRDALLFFVGRSAYLEKAEMRLLRDTDYHTLLDACRELSQRAGELGLKPGHEYNMHLDPSPEAAKFPAIIRELDPMHVCLVNEYVWIVFAGGLAHCGVRAYPPNYDNSATPGVKLGDIELIPGLWYYDEAYDGNAYHRKRIDALIEEGKKRHPSRQTTNGDSNSVK
jgi:hypothetical protein